MALSLSAQRAVARAAMRSVPGPAIPRVAAQIDDQWQGRVLDPKLRLLLHLMRYGSKPIERMTPVQARRAHAAGVALSGPAPRPMAVIEDFVADGVPGKLFRPQRVSPEGHLLVYLHGGGGVFGAVADYAALLTNIADRGRLPVAALDYRLAPEHRFPAALDDVVTGYRWIRRHAPQWGVRPECIAVGGDSRGGTLTAGLTLRCREGDAPMPAFQWHINPGFDLAGSTASYQAFVGDYVLSPSLMSWFTEHAIHDPSMLKDPFASPLWADELSGVSPAYIISAGFDPLVDEAAAYADKLRRANVPVQHECAHDMTHHFMALSGLVPRARWWFERSIDQLRRGFLETTGRHVDAATLGG